MSNPSRKPEAHPPEEQPEEAKAQPWPEGAESAGTEPEEGAAAGERARPAPEGEAPPQPSAESEVTALKDQLLRAMAELENYRRRAEKERQDTAKYAITGFARECLTVLDNLRRGLDSVTEADRAANPALETLAAGMELTERELLATFERHGITRIDPEGEPFDHNLHQAMYEVEDPSKPAGTVVQVAAPGYLLNGRLLRPAMVGVAKGGAKAEPVRAPIANEEVETDTETKQKGGPGTTADAAADSSHTAADGPDARSGTTDAPGHDPRG